MRVEIEDVRAWVDNELDEPRAGQVRDAVLFDKSLKRDADKLRASQLPYREAYEQVSVPEVPESLRRKIQALQDPSMQNTPIQNTSDKNPGIQHLPREAANNSSFKFVGLAASVLLAAVVGYLAGTNTSDEAPDTTASIETSRESDNFAQTVAAYQQFYVRETLKGTIPPDPAKVTERLADQTGMQVVIPELEGYEFMRAQRLSVDGELLLQLVYLGAEGGPLALCYMAALNNDAEGQRNGTTTLQNHHGLNTAEWRHQGHRFVIVSDVSEKKLDELSRATRRQWNS